jgi:hypothetical protein
MKKHALLTLCLLFMGTPGLMAQSLGATFTVAKPVSDIEGGSWIRGRSAAGFGLRMSDELTSDWNLVSRLDVLDVKPGNVAIRNDNTDSVQYVERTRVQISALSWDLDYDAARIQYGGEVYLGFGLGLAEARFMESALTPGSHAAPEGTSWPVRQSRMSVQYAVLIGLQLLPHAFLEARFTQANFKGVGVPGTWTQAPISSLSLVLQF